MRKRRGYSLVECLATFALIGTALTMVAVSMNGMQRACQRVRDDTLTEMELQRLALQLRTDAHAAASAREVVAADDGSQPDTLRLVLNGEESVDYMAAADVVRRELRRSEQVLHRETYRLPTAYTAQWMLETGNPSENQGKESPREENQQAGPRVAAGARDPHPVVSLRLEPEPVDRGGRPGGRALSISAAVGLIGPPAAVMR